MVVLTNLGWLVSHFKADPWLGNPENGVFVELTEPLFKRPGDTGEGDRGDGSGEAAGRQIGDGGAACAGSGGAASSSSSSSGMC